MKVGTIKIPESPPKQEKEIVLSPNSSTGFSACVLNDVYEPFTKVQMLKPDDDINTESVACFIQRFRSDWLLAKEDLNI